MSAATHRHATAPAAEHAAWAYSATTVWEAASDEERRFTLDVLGWQPSGERWHEVEARLDAAYQRAKCEHRRRLAALAEECGATKGARKASPDHYVWLVRYHLRGHGYQRIADDACRDRKSVEEAVKHAAAFIGLDLRPPHVGGRPRRR